MFKAMILVFLAAGIAACTAAGDPRRESSTHRVWNVDPAEAQQALAASGDPGAGKRAFEVCGACHLPSGAGRTDGSYPRLAGQHATVLIKQIVDIRLGARDNPGMHSFVMELRDAKDVADAAAHVEGLCIPPLNGRYPGSDSEARIAEGKALYDRDCAECHRPAGEGVREKSYPVLAGQHYRYLVRQMLDIRDGYRRNADPDMVKSIRKHPNDKLEGVAAYLASLTAPGTPCEAPAARVAR